MNREDSKYFLILQRVPDLYSYPIFIPLDNFSTHIRGFSGNLETFRPSKVGFFK